MNQSLQKACYDCGPIADLAKLAEVLSISIHELHTLCRQADRSYRLVGILKKDGSKRITWDANKRLKRVHGRINNRLLVRVKYPLYLQGGIRDREHPRDYARNAAFHAGQACVINEDISDFYPSVTSEQVFDVWSGLFRFSSEVATALTVLTTRHGTLPQGARTSSYLANLAFWRTEPEFVRHLESKGLRYSRLADDVTVSSAHHPSAAEKSEIKSLIHSFMKREGFVRKYKKQRTYGGGGRMLVNNLVVNRQVALTEEDRAEVRNIVHSAVMMLAAGHELSDQELSRVRGKIGKLRRFHPRAGKKLRARLDAALEHRERRQLPLSLGFQSAL